jgi:tetratricopeptide (TPR) repeat protein
MRQTENQSLNMPSNGTSNKTLDPAIPPATPGVEYGKQVPTNGWDTQGRRAVWVGSTRQAGKLRYDSPGKQKEKAEHAKFIIENEFEAPVRSGKKMGIVGKIGCVMFLVLLLMLGNSCFQALAFRTHFNEAKALYADGKYDRAQVEFSLAITADPGSSDSYYYRGLTEAKRGSLGNALKDYEKALALNEKNTKVYLAAASLRMKMHSYEKAAANCTTLLKLDPTFGDAYRVRAAAYAYLGRYNEAIADSTTYLDKFDDKAANRADALTKRAFAFDQKKDYPSALRDYSDAIAMNPSASSGYSGRAIVYMHMKNWTQGLEDCKAALELKPNDAMLFKIEGICYAGLKDGRDALADLDKLVAAYPTIESHRIRGDERFVARDYLGTMADFDYVLNAQPNNKSVEVKYQKAKIALQATAPKTSAVADLVPHAKMPTAAELNQPGSVLLNQGYKLMAAGDIDPAIEYLHAAVKALPTNPNARRYLANAYLARGMNTDAASQFNALSAMQRLSAGDQLAYARSLAGSNETQQAINVYTNLLAIDPKNDAARMNLIDMLLADGSSHLAAKYAAEGIEQSPAQRDKYNTLFEQAVATKNTKGRLM